MFFKKKTPPEAPPTADTRTPEEIAEELIAEWKDTRRSKDDLSVLNLSALGLNAIPESVRSFRGAEVIDLSKNKIRKLPEWIGELKGIMGLDLRANLLLHLPEQLGELSELRGLWLSGNQLKALPESLMHLSLIVLRLEDNPSLGLPKSILSRPSQEILRYYFESRAKGGQPLLELKLLLVGRGKAGKTALVKQLAGEKPDKNESETHSISIRELMLGCPKGQVRTRAWDFGGQEILHSTHQFFLTERSLYLLVLEPRDAEYWLKLIRRQHDLARAALHQRHGAAAS